jgi:transketolase
MTRRLWNASGAKATRAVSGEVLNIFAEYLPNLFGGSADLAPSNKTELQGKGFFNAENRTGANVHFGIREFAMAVSVTASSSTAGSTRSARRSSCLRFISNPRCGSPPLCVSRRVVMTHDSIGVGEDGPTHQPIEHLAALRATPNTLVFAPRTQRKPPPANYGVRRRYACRDALTRQNLPQYEETGEGAYRGGYILKDAPNGKPRNPDGQRQ